MTASPGLSNGGFADNFADMDVSSPRISFDIIDGKSAASKPPEDDLLSIDTEHFGVSPRSSQQTERPNSKTASYLSDLDGLELSPSSAASLSLTQTNPFTPPSVNWSQTSTKPHYNISITPNVAGRMDAPSANTNPFRDLGYYQHNQNNRSSMSHLQKQTSQIVTAPVINRAVATPTRPPPPQMLPKPINPTSADPLAELKWSSCYNQQMWWIKCALDVLTL